MRNLGLLLVQFLVLVPIPNKHETLFYRASQRRITLCNGLHRNDASHCITDYIATTLHTV